MSLAVLALSMSNCTDELTTNSSTVVSEETVLSSTTDLNMVLTSAYRYILMGGMNPEDLSQNDACYHGVAGLQMYYDLGGADIISTTNYGGSVENSYHFSPERTQSSGDYAKRIWSNMYKTIN